jgi:hypothetical protein
LNRARKLPELGIAYRTRYEAENALTVERRTCAYDEILPAATGWRACRRNSDREIDSGHIYHAADGQARGVSPRRCVGDSAWTPDANDGRSIAGLAATQPLHVAGMASTPTIAVQLQNRTQGKYSL